jgi:hypothetical protein
LQSGGLMAACSWLPSRPTPKSTRIKSEPDIRSGSLFHWDRGRLARSERRQARALLSTKVEVLQDQSRLTALLAGGTPAVPVKRLLS